jgi:GAF domain-containing protein
LAASGSVIGALDAQSLEPDAFSPSDIDLLRAVANQLAMAIDSLHLYEQSQRNIRENQALYQQTQANLREIERLNYQLTGRAWSDYLRLQGESAAITLDLDSGQATHDAEWTATLDEAATHRQALTVIQAGQRVVALPIVVRNEVVGAMEFELASEAALPDGVMDLVEEVGQRLGLALENRRLFDESQRAVQREALINDIGADLQAATGVEAIIQRAARHLREALAAQEVLIRLGAPTDQDNGHQTARKAQR